MRIAKDSFQLISAQCFRHGVIVTVIWRFQKHLSSWKRNISADQKWGYMNSLNLHGCKWKDSLPFETAHRLLSSQYVNVTYTCIPSSVKNFSNYITGESCVTWVSSLFQGNLSLPLSYVVRWDLLHFDANTPTRRFFAGGIQCIVHMSVRFVIRGGILLAHRSLLAAEFDSCFGSKLRST